MLFDFKLELEDVSRSNTKNILYQLHTYRFYLIITIVSIALLLCGYLLSGVVFGLGSSIIYYMYKIWIDMSLMSFNTDGLSFDLQDVINDLEGR